MYVSDIILYNKKYSFLFDKYIDILNKIIIIIIIDNCRICKSGACQFAV